MSLKTVTSVKEIDRDRYIEFEYDDDVSSVEIIIKHPDLPDGFIRVGRNDLFNAVNSVT